MSILVTVNPVMRCETKCDAKLMFSATVIAAKGHCSSQQVSAFVGISLLVPLHDATSEVGGGVSIRLGDMEVTVKLRQKWFLFSVVVDQYTDTGELSDQVGAGLQQTREPLPQLDTCSRRHSDDSPHSLTEWTGGKHPSQPFRWSPQTHTHHQEHIQREKRKVQHPWMWTHCSMGSSLGSGFWALTFSHDRLLSSCLCSMRQALCCNQSVPGSCFTEHYTHEKKKEINIFHLDQTTSQYQPCVYLPPWMVLTWLILQCYIKQEVSLHKVNAAFGNQCVMALGSFLTAVSPGLMLPQHT